MPSASAASSSRNWSAATIKPGKTFGPPLRSSGGFFFSIMSLTDVVPARELTPKLGAAVMELLTLVWPPPDDETAIAATIAHWKRVGTVHFLIWNPDQNQTQVLAHALMFPREMFTQSGPLQIGALGGVCVHPDHRGRGWGAAVARAALDYLPQMNAAVSLFQTPVPQFYQKLGCREISNFIFDGTRADGSKINPFSDKWQMIYPASFDWPDGEIDLNGPEY